MSRAYHEDKTHGTSVFPLQVYSHHDKDGFYFVSQHWHEELEWVYAEYGILNLTIHGKSLVLNPGEFCFINSGALHEIKSVGESLHHAVVFNPSFLDFSLYDACQHNFIRPITNGTLLFPTFCSTLSPDDHKQVLLHMQEIIKLYHTLPTCALLSIKLHILHMVELFFQADYFNKNTQDPELRKHFRGHYEYVVNYFTFLAQEVREYLAEMGFARLEDIIGRTDLIEIQQMPGEKKSSLLDFGKLLHRVDNGAAIHHVIEQKHDIAHVKDVTILTAARDAIENGKEISLEYTIANTDRSVGAMLAGAVAKKYGQAGLPEQTIHIKFKGSAGQSFGAFLTHGISFKLEGEANDYLGKGLSGGRIAVLPPVRSNFDAEKNTIAGNTLLYGATDGEVYINGRVGERFAVRNSGATAVVEGVGDHCCEYMTGGRVVVLGETGRNFAAGMSGGVAYVWDKHHHFDYFCNMEMVELSLIEEASYRKELHELIRQHYLYTGSKLARTMLDDWNRYVDEFIQVVPIEYKRVLQEEQMRKLQQKIADVQRDY